MFNPNNPFYGPKITSNNPDENRQNDQSAGSIPSWGIALAVILPLFLILALLVALFLLIRRRRRNTADVINEPSKSSKFYY